MKGKEHEMRREREGKWLDNDVKGKMDVWSNGVWKSKKICEE